MGREGLQSRKVHLVDEVFGIPVLLYEHDHIDHIDGDIFYIANLMEIVIAEDVGLPYSSFATFPRYFRGFSATFPRNVQKKSGHRAG